MTATATDASTQQLLESLTAESLPCQWQGCAESFTSAEQLYNHLTETHIGRKSTGNLNLQCRWGSCNVATVKRDHITSHVRVHVPLKPHTCSICQKSFKRPQDLKKHVKTHADDSLIVPSPVADNRRGPGGPGGYDQHGMYPNHSGPDMIDLRALAATATNYSYAANGHNGDSYQGYNGGAPNGSYHAAAAHHAANHYGPVYYPVAQGHPGAVFSGSRRRAYEDMNDFFGDVKHHRVAPVYSHEITQRLAGLHHILPVIQGGAATVDYQAPAVHSHYQLPQLGNLRTKSELLDGEHFLNALRSTLLESPNAAAAAGVHHPVVHYAPADLNFRSSQSPPHHPLQSPHRLSPGAHPMSSAGHQAPMMAHASSASSHGTHVLTPPPQSQPSMHNSPHASSSAAYPNLSALTTGDVSGGFTVSAGAAPASTVNSLFDRNQSHRVAGNLLQKARKDSEEIEHSDEAPSPSSRSTPGVSDRLAEGLKSVEISPGLIDPLLAGAEDEARKTPEDKEKSRKGSNSEGTDEWLEALRVVEALKEFVSRRLTNKEYVDELSRGGSPKASSEKHEAEASGSKSDDEMTELERDRVSLYPILKAVEEDD